MNNETNKATSKSMKKSPVRNTYNPVVLDHIHEKYGLSKTYIRQCLDGTRNNEMAITIRREYKNGTDKINAVLRSL